MLEKHFGDSGPPCGVPCVLADLVQGPLDQAAPPWWAHPVSSPRLAAWVGISTRRTARGTERPSSSAAVTLCQWRCSQPLRSSQCSQSIPGTPRFQARDLELRMVARRKGESVHSSWMLATMAVGSAVQRRLLDRGDHSILIGFLQVGVQGQTDDSPCRPLGDWEGAKP